MAIQATKEDNFYGKRGLSPCDTAILKIYCKSYWVLLNILHDTTSFHYVTAVLPVLYLSIEIGKDKSAI